MCRDGEVAYSRCTVSELSLGDRRGKGSESASRGKPEGTVDTVNTSTDDADGRSGGYGVVEWKRVRKESWRGGWCGAERAGVGFIPPD